jgi:hypothetical protein
MKRLALAVAVVALVACKKAETPDQPAADTAAAPAPAMADSSKMMGDTSKMMGDSAKMN